MRNLLFFQGREEAPADRSRLKCGSIEKSGEGSKFAPGRI
jgi:hypothetical protein